VPGCQRFRRNFARFIFEFSNSLTEGDRDRLIKFCEPIVAAYNTLVWLRCFSAIETWIGRLRRSSARRRDRQREQCRANDFATNESNHPATLPIEIEAPL
jgi:hypothetical protein